MTVQVRCCEYFSSVESPVIDFPFILYFKLFFCNSLLQCCSHFLVLGFVLCFYLCCHVFLVRLELMLSASNRFLYVVESVCSCFLFNSLSFFFLLFFVHPLQRTFSTRASPLSEISTQSVRSLLLHVVLCSLFLFFWLFTLFKVESMRDKKLASVLDRCANKKHNISVTPIAPAPGSTLPYDSAVFLVLFFL